MTDQSRPPVTGYPAPNYPNAAANGGASYPHAAASYPYAAPQPQGTFYYAANQDPYGQAAQRAAFLRRLFVILVASAVITGTILFIVWLVLRPQVPQFRVDSVALSGFNTSNGSLVTGSWDVGFTARNPNTKISLSYDKVEAEIFYKRDSIALTTVPPFTQGKKNETVVRASFAADSTYLGSDDVNGINSDLASGTVSFNVRLLATVRFKAGSWMERRRLVGVFCSNLAVGISASNKTGAGSLVGGSRQCDVRV